MIMILNNYFRKFAQGHEGFKLKVVGALYFGKPVECLLKQVFAEDSNLQRAQTGL